jgi:hypothetical protein
MGGECGEKLFAIPGLEDVGGWLCLFTAFAGRRYGVRMTFSSGPWTGFSSHVAVNLIAG